MDKKEYQKKYYIENRDKKIEYQRKWSKENSEYKKEYDKNYHIKNRAKRLEYSKQWREDNAEHKKICDKKWKKNNIKHTKEYYKIWCKNNHEHIKEYSREWHKNNHGEVIKKQNIYCKNKRKTDLKYNLNRKVSSAMWKTLKNNKNGRHWEDLVGYKLKDLIKRLKETMPKNYTWEDFLKGGLHIDHIVPISAHNFNHFNQIDFQNCWALSNLQLLPAEENLAKHNKLSRPFQLALKI